MRLPSFGFFLLLATIGCSNATSAPVAGTDAGLATAPRADVIEQAVHMLRRGEPSFARFLAPNRAQGFRAADTAFTSFGFRATEQKVFEHLSARIPHAANGVIEVGVARLERFNLRVTPLSARAVTAREDDGRVVYVDAYPSTDVIAVTTPQTFEEFLFLRDAAAPTTFSYAIELPRGIKTVRFEDSGALVFADARNEGVLRMPPPFAVDANGVKREAKLGWDGHVATVTLDGTGLAYPILLDPALEQFLWEKKASSGAPGQRAGAGATFHPSNTLLVGGYNEVFTALGDTWTWNGTAWTQACSDTTCGIKPSGLGGVAYNATRNRSLLVTSSGSTGEYAEWTGSTWTGITQIPYSAPSGVPNTRYQFSLTYESNPPGGGAPRVLLFGGAPDSGFGFAPSGARQNDLWAWNGGWSSILPTDCTRSPTCRWGHAATYDSNIQRLVVFGDTNETFEWNDSAWTLATPLVKPAARMGHKMVYDPTRKRTILFGGTVGGNETWEYSAGKWTQLSVVTTPPARYHHAMAFDTARNRAVVYGGVSGPTTFVPAEVWEYHGFGGSCSTAADCDTGACVDGVCCESTSCGTCQACNLSAGPGTCRPVVSADDPDTCGAPSATCDATGACKKVQGQACTTGAQCVSNFCVDGVCCASACTGTCQACAAAVKESGAENGICGPAKDGQNPHGDCTATGASSCGQTGVCNGTGTCKLWPAGTSCGAGVCDANTFKGQQCNGTGSCLSNPTGTACAPGKCISSTGCKLTCTTNADCDSTGFCDTGVCKPKKKNGEACTAGAECENPFCVDGVCCNKPCGGQCEACNSTGAIGTCVPITKDPVGGRPKCDAAPSGEPCKARQCDGVDGATCAGWVGSSQKCRDAACTDGKSVTDLFCDGKGNCPTDAPKVCAPFVCAGTICKDSCTSDSDCVAPSTCETSSGKCVDASKCDGDHTVTSADGKTTTDCSPYKCDATGKCRVTCGSTSECAGSAICASGVCTPPATTGEDTGDSGGCAVGPANARAGGALVALVLLGLARLRRRRASA